MAAWWPARCLPANIDACHHRPVSDSTVSLPRHEAQVPNRQMRGVRVHDQTGFEAIQAMVRLFAAGASAPGA